MQEEQINKMKNFENKSAFVDDVILAQKIADLVKNGISNENPELVESKNSLEKSLEENGMEMSEFIEQMNTNGFAPAAKVIKGIYGEPEHQKKGILEKMFGK